MVVGKNKMIGKHFRRYRHSLYYYKEGFGNGGVRDGQDL